jgi:crotonobetainyl-CoA:carnitine CoA-transferase CaiB-like acyl-CoA transferase
MVRDSLSGVRVLDFSHVVAGPVCGMLLADLGADVSKIEPLGGELGRAIGPPWQNGKSLVALSVNRNKRGLAIDLKTEAGCAVVRRMARSADVVVESFRPGVMARFGLDYEALRLVNPRLVYCSISAYGQTGPGREKAGVDGIIQAASGLMSTLGASGAEPCKVGVPVADMTTGYLATVAVLAALHKVQAGGLGQHLDVSLFNSTLMLQQLGLAFHLSTGDEPCRLGSAAPYAAPNEAYPTADGWLMLAAYHPDRWSRLCSLLGARHLRDDPRFATNENRVLNRALLHLELDPILRLQNTAHWLEVLGAADILCAPIATYSDVCRSPEYMHNRVEITIEHATAGPVRMPRFALGTDDPLPYRPAPELGEHSLRILADYGISEIEALALQASGAIVARDARQETAA